RSARPPRCNPRLRRPRRPRWPIPRRPLVIARPLPSASARSVLARGLPLLTLPTTLHPPLVPHGERTHQARPRQLGLQLARLPLQRLRDVLATDHARTEGQGDRRSVGQREQRVIAPLAEQ